METNYLIIPGYGNSGANHWQTHFEQVLPNCERVMQKSWHKPICTEWVNTLNEAVNRYDPATVVLISHSMGGIAIAHWANKFPLKIKGAMIVAPPDLDNPWQDLGLNSFSPIPLSAFPFPSIIVGSTNDNWVSIDRTQLFAEKWGSKLILINDAGHINVSSGYGHWEEGLRILNNEFQ